MISGIHFLEMSGAIMHLATCLIQWFVVFSHYMLDSAGNNGGGAWIIINTLLSDRRRDAEWIQNVHDLLDRLGEQLTFGDNTDNGALMVHFLTQAPPDNCHTSPSICKGQKREDTMSELRTSKQKKGGC